MTQSLPVPTDMRSLAKAYTTLYYGQPKTTPELREFTQGIMDRSLEDLQQLQEAARGAQVDPIFLRLLVRGVEQYRGALRWVRKEYLVREDGSDKRITIGTRVRVLPQPQYRGSTQPALPGGPGVVEEAASGSAVYARMAKEAVGTSSALRVRLDPTKGPKPPAPVEKARVERMETPALKIDLHQRANVFKAVAWENGLYVGHLGFRPAIFDDMSPGCFSEVEHFRRKYPGQIALGESGIWVAADVWVRSGWRRRGIGVQLYTMAIREAAKHRAVLVANHCEEFGATSEDAQATWESGKLEAVPGIERVGMAAFAPGEARRDAVERLPTSHRAQENPCTRCKGSGGMPYPHVWEGRCFRCEGSGVEPAVEPKRPSPASSAQPRVPAGAKSRKSTTLEGIGPVEILRFEAGDYLAFLANGMGSARFTVDGGRVVIRHVTQATRAAPDEFTWKAALQGAYRATAPVERLPAHRGSVRRSRGAIPGEFRSDPPRGGAPAPVERNVMPPPTPGQVRRAAKPVERLRTLVRASTPEGRKLVYEGVLAWGETIASKNDSSVFTYSDSRGSRQISFTYPRSFRHRDPAVFVSIRKRDVGIRPENSTSLIKSIPYGSLTSDEVIELVCTRIEHFLQKTPGWTRSTLSLPRMAGRALAQARRAGKPAASVERMASGGSSSTGAAQTPKKASGARKSAAFSLHSVQFVPGVTSDREGTELYLQMMNAKGEEIDPDDASYGGAFGQGYVGTAEQVAWHILRQAWSTDGVPSDQVPTHVLPRGGLAAFIEDVEVAPGLRGQQWGRRVWESFADAAKKLGAVEVFLQASPDSVSFWEHMGFQRAWPVSDNLELMHRGIEGGRAPTSAAVERMGVVVHESTLYHGTSLDRLPAIFQQGLRPRKEHGVASRHQTKTTQAVFATDSLEGAWLYADADRLRAAVLEIDPEGLDFSPDYDDVGVVLDVDLSELRAGLKYKGWDPDELPAIVLGADLGPSSGDLAADAERVIESLNDAGGERAEPVTLELVYKPSTDGEEHAILHARPFVGLPVSEAADRIPELADMHDLSYDEGRPVLLVQQYLCHCVIPPDRIRGVLVWEKVARGQGSAGGSVTDYGTVTIDGVEAEWADEVDPDVVDFAIRRLRRLTLEEAVNLVRSHR